MKCEKCNSELKKKDRFCGNCGQKVENKVVEKFLKENKMKILLSGILVIVMIASYFIYDYVNKPSFIAQNYFNAVINNNYKKVLKYINLEETNLMNLELLKSKNEELKNVKNIEIVDEKIYENEALITFKYKINNDYALANVLLNKENNKWVVNSGRVVNNITIKVPTNSKILLDNIDISSYLKEKTDNYDIYKIDYMATGKYNLKITLKSTEEIEEEFIPENNNIYTLKNIKLSEENKNKINEKTSELINSIYSGIINNLDSINYNETINKYYQDLKYSYNKNNVTLKNFEIKNIHLISTDYSSGKLNATYQVEYNYLINYNNEDIQSLNRNYVIVTYDYNEEYEVSDIDSSLNFKLRK